MTVAEATNIADNALEHTVRTILASLQAPEILKSTSGVTHLQYFVETLVATELVCHFDCGAVSMMSSLH